MKNKKVKEITQIKTEIRWLYANYNKISIIMNVKQPSCNNSSIGEIIPHVKKSNYKSVYKELFENEKFTILFTDMSMVCLYYRFDKSGAVVGHNLMFFPAPNDEDNPNDFDTICAKYIRIDYDQTAYKEIDHTKVHLHIGLYKTNFRLPVAHFFSPKEFIFFVAKYIYHNNSSFLDKLLCARDRNILLSNDEQKAVKLLFGRIEETRFS